MTSNDAFASHRESSRYFQFGHAAILFGDLRPFELEEDLQVVDRLAGWLNSVGLGTEIIPHALTADLRSSLLNPTVSIVIWFGHGTPKGFIADSEGRRISDDDLSGIDSRAELFVSATCYGGRVCDRFVLQNPGLSHMDTLGTD